MRFPSVLGFQYFVTFVDDLSFDLVIFCHFWGLC